MKKLVYLTFASLIILSSCKYEEGKNISLRTKRDRISNEWFVTDYSINGEKNDNAKNMLYSGDSIAMVLTIMRTNNYNLTLQYKPDAKKYNKIISALEMNLLYKTTFRDRLDGDSIFLHRSIGKGGKWSFANHHKEIHFEPSFDVSNPTIQNHIAKIIMLSQKKIKLEFTDKDWSKHTITFEALNEEFKEVILD